MRPSAVEYAPRHSETTALYQVVAEELETFLSRQQERDRPVPDSFQVRALSKLGFSAWSDPVNRMTI